MFNINIILLIIFAIYYYFNKTSYLILVFFLCSLLFIYLGAVTFVALFKNKNIFDIIILTKKLIRIIFSFIILLNYNSNADWITLYSNYILENGLTDESAIQEVVDTLGLTPNQQYYLKIGIIITAFSVGVIIIYFLNNSLGGPGASSIESYSYSNAISMEVTSGSIAIPSSVRHMEYSDSGYSNTIPMEVTSESTIPSSVRHMEYSDSGYSNTIPMEVISESTVISEEAFKAPEVVEYIITDSFEAVLTTENE